MQTQPGGAKPEICLPIQPFENANQSPFSNPNNQLANYHFWFSESSTRFPCDFFQPTVK